MAKEYKEYLEEGSKIYSTGCRLIITDNETLDLWETDEDMFYDGLLVNHDEGGYFVAKAELEGTVTPKKQE